MENNNMKIVIASLIAVLVVGGGVFALSSNDTSTEDAGTDSSQQTAQQASETPEPVAEEEKEVAAEAPTIVGLAQDTESLSTLVAAVVEADLVETLNSDGPFTVFAPTNDAFSKLLDELDATAEQLLAREDLADILTYHVVSGKVMAADLSDGQKVKTVQGEMLEVTISDSGVTLTDVNDNVSTIVSTDIEASNGIVHVIDTVVLP